MHDQVCFHCQQAAEKYLKALMEEQGQPIPKTHDLEVLLTSLSPAFPGLLSLQRGLLILVDYAVDTRYPGNQTADSFRASLGGKSASGLSKAA